MIQNDPNDNILVLELRDTAKVLYSVGDTGSLTVATLIEEAADEIVHQLEEVQLLDKVGRRLYERIENLQAQLDEEEEELIIPPPKKKR